MKLILKVRSHFHSIRVSLDPYSNIENIRSNNPNRLIVAQLNINSLIYKFDLLVEILHSNVDILLISETKIDSSFPTAQFKTEGYTTYRLDRYSNGGGILLYVRQNTPSTLLNIELLIEGFCIEINIRKKKAFSLHIQSKQKLNFKLSQINRQKFWQLFFQI